MALVQRHIYLLMGSWPRLIELLYWPTISMIVWGFLNIYLAKQTGTGSAIASFLLGGAIMWEVLLRSQFSVLIPFFEELWSRNLGHIFVSPVSPLEYVGGLTVLSTLRTLIAMTPCFILAELLFGFWLPGMGLPFIGFYINLAMSGWWCSFLIVSLILRYGLGAEWLAWMAAFAISPLVAIYYPVTTLPTILQHVAWALPPTYVFEGMRSIINENIVRADYMAHAFLLNLLYLVLSATVFLRTFEATRRANGLLQMGE